MGPKRSAPETSRPKVEVSPRSTRSMSGVLRKFSTVSIGLKAILVASPKIAAATALQMSTSKPRQAPCASRCEKPGTFGPTPQVRKPLCLTASSRSPACVRAAARAATETVLVVGAGLAGLCAAYRLREAGKRVIVIEARPVPGGRVRTLRGYFDDGIYAELGAARVAESHEYVLTWLNDLGLSLMPFAPSGASVQVLGTHRARSDDEAARERLAPDLHRDERGLGSGDLLRKYTQGGAEELGPAAVDLSNPRWREFDAVTWPA